MTRYDIRHTLELKGAPEVMRAIRAADSTYRKHKAFLVATDEMELQGTYWDGGSRTRYTAVDFATGRVVPAPSYAPPQFGGPQTAPCFAIPAGIAIVATGTFCGKTATASVYVAHETLAKLLPSAVQS